MADPCICSDNLEVTETGELCAIPGSIGLRQVLVITASTTFDKATYPWLARVRAIVVGGGGGGGGTEETVSFEVAAGSGGGGGGAAEVIVDAASLLASETVTVGAGGTAGAGVAGGAGGSSVFGAHAVATGGDGGGAGIAVGATFDAAAVAAGGAGTSGDVLYQGGDGDAGIACDDAAGEVNSPRIAIGGSGGGSLMAGRTRDRIRSVGGVGFANSGRGGFGASAPPNTAAAAGRPGGSGIVLVYLYA